MAAAGGPDGGSVAAAGEEGVTRVWDVRAGSDLVRASEQAGTAGRGFDWGLNGRTATRDYDGVVRVWERGASTPVLTLQGGRIEPGQDPKHEVDFSPDGTKIAVGGPDLRVRVWDATSGKVVQTFSTPASDVFSTQWSPDGTRIACTGWGWSQVWEVSTGRTVKCASRTIKDLRMWGLAWSPSGDRVAICGDDQKAKCLGRRLGPHTDRDPVGGRHA